MEEIVRELNTLIEENGWQSNFDKAVKMAQDHEIYNFPELQKWNDYRGYLEWLNHLVHWAPRERGDTRFVYDKITEFYFILDQEPVKKLQSPITPGGCSQELTPLSK